MDLQRFLWSSLWDHIDSISAADQLQTRVQSASLLVKV